MSKKNVEEKGLAKFFQENNEVKENELSEMVHFIAKRENYPLERIELERVIGDIMNLLDLSKEKISAKEQKIVSKFLEVIFNSDYYLKDEVVF